MASTCKLCRTRIDSQKIYVAQMVSVDDEYLIQVSRIKWIEWILFDLGYPVQMVKNEVNGGGRV